MAAAATRDMLAVTSSLFDKSDEIYDETKRLARAAQSRKAVADAAEIRRFAASGVDTTALTQVNAPLAGAKDLTALTAALRDCKDAAAALAGLQEQRDAVIEARREAIEQHEARMAASRDQLRAELQANASATDASYLAKLRELVAGAAASGSTSASGVATSAQAVAQETPRAAQDGAVVAGEPRADDAETVSTPDTAQATPAAVSADAEGVPAAGDSALGEGAAAPNGSASSSSTATE